MNGARRAASRLTPQAHLLQAPRQHPSSPSVVFLRPPSGTCVTGGSYSGVRTVPWRQSSARPAGRPPHNGGFGGQIQTTVQELAGVGCRTAQHPFTILKLGPSLARGSWTGPLEALSAPSHCRYCSDAPLLEAPPVLSGCGASSAVGPNSFLQPQWCTGKIPSRPPSSETEL